VKKSNLKKLLASVLKEMRKWNKRGFAFGFQNAKNWQRFIDNYWKIKKPRISVKLFCELLHKASSDKIIFKKINNWEKTANNILKSLDIMMKNNPQQFFVIGELNNVEVKQKLKINLVQLKKFTNRDANYFKKLGFKHRELTGFVNKSVVIYGPMKAQNHRKALQEGIFKIEEFLDILRFCYGFKERSVGNLMVRFGIRDFLYGHAVSFSKNYYHANTIWKRVIIVDKNFIKRVKKIGLKYLQKIIDKKKKNEIENKILDAIHWFGLAKMSYDKKQEFIAYFTSLEILLSAGSEKSISGDLSERIPKILFWKQKVSFNEKKNYYQNIKKLYGKRSALIHGKTTISDEELRKLNNICLMVICRFVSLYKKCKWIRREDFNNWVLKTSF